jgi:hypothetical protein
MITPARYSSGWESGCGPADPKLSNISTTAYTGTGYSVVGTGEVGTINPGANTPVNPGMSVPRVRFFLGQDGNLYALTGGGAAFVIPPTAVPVQPPIYSPTDNG